MENWKMEDEELVANILNAFFVAIVLNLVIRTQHKFLNASDNLQDPIQNAICKY